MKSDVLMCQKFNVWTIDKEKQQKQVMRSNSTKDFQPDEFYEKSIMCIDCKIQLEFINEFSDVWVTKHRNGKEHFCVSTLFYNCTVVAIWSV